MQTFHTYDVFTDRRFGGNPLAVVSAADGLDEATMQQIAREFNYSETVFLQAATEAGCAWCLRIFTPSLEMRFAGHPTIGAALHLAWQGLLGTLEDGATRTLQTMAGPVPVQFSVQNGQVQSARLTAPEVPTVLPVSLTPAQLAELLALDEGDFPPGVAPVMVSCGMPYLLVALSSREALSRLRLQADAWHRYYDPAWRKLFAFAPDGVLGYVPQQDGVYAARMMWMERDVPMEDPATGGAASSLAGWLASQQEVADGEWRWTLHQGEDMGRFSVLHLTGRKQQGRVLPPMVGGGAVPIMQGQLR
ncbi:PhzF family phenazine biosynthesis protein [Leeia aquatica]|uniref:PhzF family phenazine biosynthesis protein n=1 Tax=Leeia aquatica TaxID=2725557 RepID=A0A847SAX5_9NEIS|nr:PhzF family phenazine biosynthesis protein [Leeia aquatica]NLR74686.1 PhzF family phenazine biosynthesis protein [Leeia aquatica]